MASIGVVVVTFNRLDKLKQTLNSYEKQTFPPVYLIVVDNCSTDGTEQFLNEWLSISGGIKKKVLSLPVNTGGSGGYHAGLKCALEMNADWVWVGDDDAYPSPDSFYKINQYILRHDMTTVSALCGKVVTKDGIDTWHRRVLERHIGILRERKIDKSNYNNNFYVTFLSYVGSVISKKALTESGLPEADFFIAYDDSEHSYRLSKHGDIICLPDVCIFHDTNEIKAKNASWKQYYGVRNKLYSYRKHFGILQAGYLTIYYILKYFLNPVQREMIMNAIVDAYRGALGQHKKYRPGWKG